MITRRKGHIINVASVAASIGVPGLGSYCASKFAMLGFSETLSHELHNTGVNITVVSPIGVKTNFFKNQSFNNRVPNYTIFNQTKTVSKSIFDGLHSRRLEIIYTVLYKNRSMD